MNMDNIIRENISREKFEPEPGFEPRTSGFLPWRSSIELSEVRVPVQVQIFLLKFDNVNFQSQK